MERGWLHGVLFVVAIAVVIAIADSTRDPAPPPGSPTASAPSAPSAAPPPSAPAPVPEPRTWKLGPFELPVFWAAEPAEQAQAPGARIPEPGTRPGVDPAGTVPDVPPAFAWYSVEPLLVSLRPELRASPRVVAAEDRLPLYELDMDVEEQSFALRETLWFTNDEDFSMPDVALRIYANAVGDAKHGAPVRVLSVRCLEPVRCRVEQPSASALRVVPEVPLAPGERLRVQLELGGVLTAIDDARLDLMAQGVEGMATLGGHGGAGDYGLLARGDGIASFANFYAVLARRDARGWQLQDASTVGDLGSDTLSHVALRVLLPPGHHAYASGVRVGSREPGRGPKQVEEFAASFVRDFSVLVSSRLRSDSLALGDVQVRSHYLAADANAGQRVLQVAHAALALYEERFGPYPYADFDVVQAPLVGGAGGVEFSGLVTVASMFYRKPGTRARGMPGLENQQELFDAMLEFVTAHEVAHQYFHGLVGSDSRESPFTDEGLAQFGALLYMEARYGRERAELEAERQVAMNYQLMRMLGLPDAAVLQPVAAFESPVHYAGLVYGKGPLFYRELRAAVGDRVMFGALQEYVRSYGFRTAPRDGFIDIVSRMGTRGVVERLARHWLHEANGDADLGGGALADLFAGTDFGPGETLQSLMAKLMGKLSAGGGEGELEGLGMPALERMLGATTTRRPGAAAH